MGIKNLLARLFKRMLLPIIKKSVLDKTVWIGSGSHIINSKINYGTYLGNDTNCINAVIGKYCSIGNHCNIGAAEHPSSYVSTSPVFYDGYKKHFWSKKLKLGSLEWDSYSKKVVVGNDVWIGENVLIKSGIKIGNGSIIGAGAVVTKDVPPYEVWAGVPAKFIKKRFPDSIANKLTKSEWWDVPPEKIKDLSRNMDNPGAFLKRLEEINN